MAKTKQQKQEILAKLEDAFQKAASTVFVSFTAVTVAEETEMRKALRSEGLKYFVAKKTLINRALTNLGHKAEEVPMEGEIAVAYHASEGGDVTAPARMIHATAQKLKDKLSIAGGLFEGKLLGALGMREIATIPPVEALRGMFANVINSPRSRFAIVLSKVAEAKN